MDKGPYEVICQRLKCCSPWVLCGILRREMAVDGQTLPGLRVMDFGAGPPLYYHAIVGCKTRH